MNLVDTDQRLIKHVKGWKKRAQGRLSALERNYPQAGIAQKDISFAKGRLLALEEVLILLQDHIDQVEDKQNVKT